MSEEVITIWEHRTTDGRNGKRVTSDGLRFFFEGFSDHVGPDKPVWFRHSPHLALPREAEEAIARLVYPIVLRSVYGGPSVVASVAIDAPSRQPTAAVAISAATRSCSDGRDKCNESAETKALRAQLVAANRELASAKSEIDTWIRNSAAAHAAMEEKDARRKLLPRGSRRVVDAAIACATSWPCHSLTPVGVELINAVSAMLVKKR